MDLSRKEASAHCVVVLREERDPELLGLRLADPLPEVLPRVEDRPAAHEKDRDREVAVVQELAEDVHVLAGHGLHALLLGELLHRAKAVAVRGRHLEVLGLGGGPHLLLEAGSELLVLPREEKEDVLDGLGVRGRRRETRDARPEAGVHVVVEARARKRPVDLDPAGPDLEHPLDHLHGAAARAGRQERPEVAVPVPEDPSRHERARPGLPRRDLDVRVRLVVAEEDVVAGPVLLDEGVLEGEGLALGLRDDRVDRGELGEERLRLRVLRPGVEVRREPLADRARLPDIQDLPGRVLVKVDAG